MRKFVAEISTMHLPVYLDYNATTPVDDQVLESMLPYFSEKFGNASSRTHAFGWMADAAVKKAREQVAGLIHAEPGEIIFTSGATEAVNLALKGVYESYRSKGNHIVTVATEHKAVLDTCAHLEKLGAHITFLPVREDGLIDLNLLEQSIQINTIAVAVMHVNNETGVIQPMKEIAEIVHDKKCLLMSDATQSCGKIPVNVHESGIDLLCMSAHKMYGPKGVGALYVRRKNPRVSLSPLIDGGGHEKGMRSGTLNVPGIVGLGKACEIAIDEMKENSGRILTLRNYLETELLASGHVFVNGNTDKRLYNVSNLSFSEIKAEVLITELNDVAVSTGSACSSAIPEPSHVLKAMMVKDELAFSSVRFSLGKYTTQEEIIFCVERIEKIIQQKKNKNRPS